MTKKSIRFAVVADLHAFDPAHVDAGKEPSWLRTDESQCSERDHPFKNLFVFLEKHKIEADYLLCCGDMGNQSHPTSQHYAWSRLRELRVALKAKRLIGTAGNHDLDSRGKYSDNDPKGLLQSFNDFPTNDELESNHYWSKNYVILNCDGVRLVVLNSAAFHGYGGKDFETEYERGRVSDRTIEALLKDLKAEGAQVSNILLCHHHPLRLNFPGETESSEMVDGDKLLNSLSEADLGDWMVIHGHKHLPRLLYGSGSTGSAPIIFSAGSFSTRKFPVSTVENRNDFYVVEVQVPDNKVAAPMVGQIFTWSFSYGIGWRIPGASGGIPHRAGFGHRVHPSEVAAKIRLIMEEEGAGFIRWEKVAAALPELQHLMPEDQRRALTALESQGVRISFDDKQEPHQLERRSTK
jgi:calcineurin-like phosphoesterase family protein